MQLASLFLTGALLISPPGKVNVSGNITTGDGEPVPGVAVLVGNSNDGSSTNSSGYYSFRTSPGIKNLQVRHLGTTIKDTLVDIGGDIVVSLTIEESALSIDDVIITGTRQVKALKDTPVITQVISRPEIEKISPLSLMDVLESELPGIEFTRTEGETNSIRYKGLDASYLLILVDGERLAGETSRSNPDFNRIDVDNIERIEVIKGSMSTLYGSGAVAGVINIITRDASKPLHANVSGQYDSEGAQKYGIELGSKQDRLSLYTTATYRHKSSFTLDNTSSLKYYYEDGTVVDRQDITAKSQEIEGYKNYAIEQRVGYEFSNRLKANLRGSFYNHERFNAGVVGKKVRNIYRDWNVNGQIEYKLNHFNRFDLSHRFDDYSKFDKYLVLGTQERNYRNRIHNTRINYFNDRWRGNSMLIGAELFAEDLVTYQFIDGEKESIQTVALYIQDDYKFNATYSLSAGARLDYHSTYGAHFTPALSAMARYGIWTLRAGYAAGYRAPSLKELYTQWDHQGMFELVGNPDLKPEKSDNVFFSAEVTTRRVNISASGFYNNIRDKIDNTSTWNDAGDMLFYSNIEGHTETLGADMNLRIDLPYNFVFRSGYAYVNDKMVRDGYNVSSTRPHSLNARLDYNFRVGRNPFSAGISGRWVSKVDVYSFDSTKDMYRYQRYDSYSIWKLNISAKIRRAIKVNAGINNLFNYKPDYITFNTPSTKGISYFVSLNISLDELCKKR